MAGAPSVAFFDRNQNAVPSRENELSKIELLMQTRDLEASEDEKRVLQDQLDLEGTGYDSKIVELESKIMDLEGQVEELQDQLKRQDYVAVGLTFFWK